mgnify:CR=1 FL=1
MMQTFDKSAWYTIAAKVSGKVIEAENASTENGAAVCLAEATGADQQLWSITHIDGKYYGANLHQWEYVNGDSQLWFFEEKDDGAVAIKSAMSAKCIDVVGMNADADGARLQIWVDVDGDNQSWFIREAKAEAPVAEAAEEPKAEAAAAEQPKEEATEIKTEEAPAKKTTTRTRKPAAKKTNESRAKRKRRTKAEIAADAAAAPAKKTTTRTRKSAAKKTTAASKTAASKTEETK